MASNCMGSTRFPFSLFVEVKKKKNHTNGAFCHTFYQLSAFWVDWPMESRTALFSGLALGWLHSSATQQTEKPNISNGHSRLCLETQPEEKALDRGLVFYWVGWPSRAPLTMLPSCPINYLHESPLSNCARTMHIHKSQRLVVTLIDVIIFLVCVRFHSETHQHNELWLHRAAQEVTQSEWPAFAYYRWPT